MALTKTFDRVRGDVFGSFADLIADTKTYANDTLLYVPSIEATYKCVSASGNLGQTNAGGQELDVVKVENGYDIRAFGAVGDGSNDDQPAFLLAYAAGDVWVPEGTFAFKNPADLTTGSRKIKGNGTFVFHAGYVTSREGTANEQLYFFNVGTDGSRPNTASNVPISNVRFEGLTFDGTAPASVSGSTVIYKSCHIEVGIGSGEVDIVGCKFINARKNPTGDTRATIFGRTQSYEVKVDRCLFDNPTGGAIGSAGGLAFSGDKSTCTNSTFINSSDASISFDNATNCIAYGNTIKTFVETSGELTSVGALVHISYGCVNCSFVDNHLIGVSNVGIYVFSNLTFGDHKNLNISNNIIDGGNATSDGSTSFLIDCDQYVSKSIINNNTLHGVTNYASGSFCIRVYPRDNQVCNNIISDLDEDGNRAAATTGGLLIRFDDDAKEVFHATGNIIKAGLVGIELSSGDYLNQKQMIIEDNTIVADTTNGSNTSVYGIDISNSGTRYLRINNNSFHGTFSSEWAGTWDYIAYFQGSNLSHMKPQTQIGYQNKVLYRAAAPTTKDWLVGDIIYNVTPSAGGNIGWVCVTAGTPGTWKSFGTIAS